MTKLLSICTTIALLATGGIALAGEEKCSGETEVCVRQMVDYIKKKGWIGIEMNAKSAAGHQQITRVLSGSPAEAAGYQVGDALLAINGVEYSPGNKEALKEAKKSIVPGQEVVFTVLRDGNRIDLPVVPSPIPDHILAQWVGEHVIEGHMAAAAEEGEKAGSPR